jgi:predicted ATP-grasp superfamily ATP-dependent carboligase
VVLYRLEPHDDLIAPVVIVALDGWVDAGSAATVAAERLIDGAAVAATFENDLIFDYRARRPILEIADGRPTELTWPELVLYRTRVGDHDVLVLTGHEPDYRWRELADSAVDLARQLDVSQWISLGAIPAAVPHTRAVPILGTESRPGLLRGDVRPGPDGLLRVPAAAISVFDIAVARAGIPTVGYFAQVPHYMSGNYPGASAELLRSVGRHLDEEIDVGELTEEARKLRDRLDLAAEADDTTRTYVARLESMVDESRLPSGDDLISDIERFLRDRGNEGSQRT